MSLDLGGGQLCPVGIPDTVSSDANAEWLKNGFDAVNQFDRTDVMLSAVIGLRVKCKQRRAEHWVALKKCR